MKKHNSILHQTIAKRILQRLEFIKINPSIVLNLSDHRDDLFQQLSEKYPNADVKDDGEADLVVSNLMIHEDFEQMLQRVIRLLKPDGIFIFTLLGVDSLKEMRHPQLHFPDLHNIGDALLAFGFQAPVMDVERLMFTYDDKNKILPDMEEAGFEIFLSDYRSDTLESGLYPLSFEIIYGLAYKPVKPKQHVHDNEVRISIDAITKKR